MSQTATFIPLMGVQARFRNNIYTMPVREHQSAADATAASLAARARLRRPMPAIAAPTPVLRPSPANISVPEADYYGPRAPLNMLAPPSSRFLIALAAARTGVSVAEIMGKNRKHAIAAARHEAIALVYAYTNQSLPAIGRIFGGRDHTTILHAVRKLKAVKLIGPDMEPDVPPLDPIQTDWKAKAEELTEEIRQLKDEVGASPSIEFNKRCSDVFGMTPARAKLLSLLMAGKVKSRVGLWLAHYDGSRERPDIHIIHTMVSYLNKDLRPHGVQISTVFGEGYVLKEPDRARIAEMLGLGAGL